jgi:hypothetical protein
MDNTQGPDTTTRIDQLLENNAQFAGTMKSFAIASVLVALAHEKHDQNRETVNRGQSGIGALEVTQSELRQAQQTHTSLLAEIRQMLTNAWDDKGELKPDFITITPEQRAQLRQGAGVGSSNR